MCVRTIKLDGLPCSGSIGVVRDSNGNGAMKLKSEFVKET